MGKARIEKLLSQHEKRAYTDFKNYQLSGAKRYLYSYCRNEDLADALRMALSVADKHQAYISMKFNISNFAQRAQQLLIEADKDKTQSLLKDLVSYGILEGLIRKD